MGHLYDNWKNRGVRHHKTLSISSYPFKIRLKRDGILVPQRLAINSMYHAPSSHEPSAVILSIILVVENDSMDKCIVGTIPSRISKMSQCQTRIVSDSSHNS